MQFVFSSFLSYFTAQCIIGPILLFAAVCSDPSNEIQTEPVLVQNVLARNFNELKLSVKLQLVGDLYYWTHPGLTRSQTTIYNPISQCTFDRENGFEVICQKVSCGKSTYIISSLTLMFSLDTDVTFTVYQQNSFLQVAAINIHVKGKLISIRRDDL